jgi:hypothetical protein
MPATERRGDEVSPGSGGASMSAPDDMVTVEHRLGRVKAVMVAMQGRSRRRRRLPRPWQHLHISRNHGREEMAKVWMALGTEVLNRDC